MLSSHIALALPRESIFANYGKQLQNAWVFPVHKIYLWCCVRVCANVFATVWNSGVQSAANRPNVTWFQCVFMFDFPLGFHASDHCKWPLCGFNFNAKQIWISHIHFGTRCVKYIRVHSSEILSILSLHVSLQRCYLLPFGRFHQCGWQQRLNNVIMICTRYYHRAKHRPEWS